ncbi:MAG: hypothetical protein WHU54_07025 [Candidatus Bathyarchaeia archaeon]
MFKSFRDKIVLSGVTVLFIGIALLIFTFFSAYGYLTESIMPLSANNLTQTFGEALGPLIAAAIHIMYLGVMGWVGSLITIRGVTIMINAAKSEVAAPTSQASPVSEQNKQLEPQAAKTKQAQ